MDGEHSDVLIVVEDPGAANYVASLPTGLSGLGISSLLLAGRKAGETLASLGIPFETLPASNGAVGLIRDTNPRLLVVGTSEDPDAVGLDLIDAARPVNLPSLAAVDSVTNARHRFRGRSDSPLKHAPNWLVVPDSAARQAYEKLGFPQDRIVVLGHPHYDYVRQYASVLAAEGMPAVRRRLLPDVPEDQRIIVFISELSTGPDVKEYELSPAYTLRGRGGHKGRTEIVVEEFLDAVRGIEPRCFLVLRLHPKEPAARFGKLQDEFDVVSVAGSPLDLVYASDLVVGMTSMLMQESILLGRPVLSVLPREVEREWLPCADTKLIRSVTRRAEIKPAIECLLRITDFPGCGEMTNVGASERFAGFVAQLLCKQPEGCNDGRH